MTEKAASQKSTTDEQILDLIDKRHDGSNGV